MIDDLRSPNTFDTRLGERVSANVTPCWTFFKPITSEEIVIFMIDMVKNMVTQNVYCILLTGLWAASNVLSMAAI